MGAPVLLKTPTKEFKCSMWALVLAAREIEHHEIVAYGRLAQVARVMGNEKIAGMLKDTLIEQKDADDMLIKPAESGINEATTIRVYGSP